MAQSFEFKITYEDRGLFAQLFIKMLDDGPRQLLRGGKPCLLAEKLASDQYRVNGETLNRHSAIERVHAIWTYADNS